MLPITFNLLSSLPSSVKSVKNLTCFSHNELPINNFQLSIIYSKTRRETTKSRHLIISMRNGVCSLLFTSTRVNGSLRKRAETRERDFLQTKLSLPDLGIKNKTSLRHLSSLKLFSGCKDYSLTKRGIRKSCFFFLTIPVIAMFT